MDFTFSDEQRMFAETAQNLLADTCSPEHLRQLLASGNPREESRWNAIVETGLTLVLLPEEAGGIGLSELDFLAIAEAAGYAALPEPLVESAGVAAPLVAAAGAGADILADPTATIAIQHPLNPFVADADTAAAIVLVDGQDIHLVRREDVTLTRQESIDLFRRLFRADWTPKAETKISSDPALLEDALDRAALFAAAQGLGLAQRCVDLSVDYAKERTQFGKPIGSYQAIKHHLATAQVKIEFARPVVQAAAADFANRDAQSRARISQAKFMALEAADVAARTAVQVHGGMGYTWEVDVHFFLKRALGLTYTWGDPTFHRNRVAERMFTQPLGPDQTFAREVKMPEAYIIDAVRTPVGRKNGSLAHLHPADLAAHPIKALVERTGVDPSKVDDVVWGCCDTIGGQAGDIGRTAWLVAGMPEEVPGVTIDRQCGSSQQAVHFAAQGVMSGTQDLVVAGGSQAMNRIPISAAMIVGQQYGFESPFIGAEGWDARYGTEEVNQIKSAEMIANKWNISREAMEAFAVESHRRAHEAIQNGWFKGEIAAYGDFDTDETVRPGTTMEVLAGLRTVNEGGVITAGVASQNSDAAAAMLIASEKAVKEYGLKPRARIHHLSVRADNPVWMLTGPIPATQYALKKAGMSISDIDLFECNEAFASVPIAWMQELGIPHEKVNVQGGAIALGHPIGATGARLMTTLLNALERTGGRYGLQTMCEGGGQANVTIIERL